MRNQKANNAINSNYKKRCCTSLFFDIKGSANLIFPFAPEIQGPVLNGSNVLKEHLNTDKQGKFLRQSPFCTVMLTLVMCTTLW